MHQREQAMADYDEAIRIDPESIALCWRAYAHTQLGRLEEALDDLARGSDVSTPDEGHRDGVAWHLQEAAWFLSTCPDPRLHRPHRAAELATEARKIMPMAGYIWAAMGAAHYRAGNWPAALEALEQAAKLPSYRAAAARFFLAMTLWKLDNTQDAHRWYHEAVDVMEQTRPYQQDELGRLRAEAAELLGITETRK
jgi:tetratricopeptide (TPR) repeat protein